MKSCCKILACSFLVISYMVGTLFSLHVYADEETDFENYAVIINDESSSFSESDLSERVYSNDTSDSVSPETEEANVSIEVEDISVSSLEEANSAIISDTTGTFTVYYHLTDNSTSSSQTTTVTYGLSTSTLTIRQLEFINSGYVFNGWKAYRSVDEKWYLTDENGNSSWLALDDGELPNGYSFYLYSNGCSVSRTASSGEVHFYAQWISSKLDVTDFGADGSDNSDDRIAIQNVLNYAKISDEQIIVKVPAGNYYISGTLIIYSNTQFILDKEATIIRTDDASTMLCNGSIDSSITYGGYTKSSNIVISGGTWDGNVTVDSDGYGENSTNLIFLSHASEITISNVTVKNCCGNHHIELAAVENVTIDTCDFEDFIYYSGTDYSYLWDEDYEYSDEEIIREASITSEAIQLDYAREETCSSALPYDDTSCNNITITNCTFTDCLSGVGSHHEDIESYNYTITNNTFTNIASRCISIPYVDTVLISENTASNIRQFAYVSANSENVTISNNTINHQNKGGSTSDNSIHISDSNVSVSGNSISNSGSAGIRTVSGTTGTIENNIITSPGTHGISADGCGTLTISSNTITGVGSNGIQATNSEAACTITRNKITVPDNASGNGIYLSGYIGSVKNNTVTGGKSSCICVSGSGSSTLKVTISSNTLSGSDENAVYSSGSYVTISSNTISKAGTAGIRVVSGTVGTIENNTITSSGTHGISVDACGMLTISSNTITGERNNGIQATNSAASCTITENKITVPNNASGNGIYLSGYLGTVKSNVVTGGKSSCIYMSDSGSSSSKVIISSNTLSGSSENAVYISNSYGTVSNNTVSKAGTAGIRVVAKSNVTVSGNTVTGNGTHGISVNISSATITNNTIESSGSNGIHVIGGTVEITGNAISESSGYGIYVINDTDNNYISSGTVSGNTVYVQKISVVSTVTTKNNTVSTESKATLATGKISSLTNTTKGIKIKWSNVSGASGYYVYRKKASAKSYTKVATITSTSTVSYTDTKVKNKNGITYMYKIVPYSGSTEGSGTAKTTVRLTSISLTSVKNTSSKKVTIKWTGTTEITGYQIQYSNSKTFSSSNKSVKVSNASKVKKVISGLTKGTTYYIRIRTYKTVDGKTYYSAWSSKKSVKISE